MGLAESLIRILITSAILALWTVFIQPIILPYFVKDVKFGYLETFVAYLIIMVVALAISNIIIKAVRGYGEE
jgi:hypothetical protein